MVRCGGPLWPYKHERPHLVFRDMVGVTYSSNIINLTEQTLTKSSNIHSVSSFVPQTNLTLKEPFSHKSHSS